MKKHLAPYLLGLLAAVSCGTSARYAAGTQQFEDGIYADPRAEAPVAAVSQEEMDALVKESIESEVYVLSASGDTVVVPEGKVAKLRFNTDGTDIAVFDNYGWDYSWSYRPWYLYGYGFHSPWYYSSWSYWDPWYWDPWYYRPWRHYGYYSPWAWHDPWYYSSWYYDPWYYDPWYWGPSYYGYYGYGYYPGWYGYHGYYGHYYGGYYGVGGWSGRWIQRNSHAFQVGHRDGSRSTRSLVSRGGASRGSGLTRSSGLTRAGGSTATTGGSR
ncbi:MAG: hypothetical protein IKM75_07340, partial [Bacteroidales bacterium]|nr:hypothetical protein [Bacteroidales bacterium]